MFQLYHSKWVKYKKDYNKKYKNMISGELCLRDRIIFLLYIISACFLPISYLFSWWCVLAISIILFIGLLVTIIILSKKRWTINERIKMHECSRILPLMRFLERNQLNSDKSVEWLLVCSGRVINKKQLFAPLRDVVNYLKFAVIPIMSYAITFISVDFMIVQILLVLSVVVFFIWIIIKVNVIDPYYAEFSFFSDDLEYIKTLSKVEKKRIMAENISVSG